MDEASITEACRQDGLRTQGALEVESTEEQTGAGTAHVRPSPGAVSAGAAPGLPPPTAADEWGLCYVCTPLVPVAAAPGPAGLAQARPMQPTQNCQNCRPKITKNTESRRPVITQYW